MTSQRPFFGNFLAAFRAHSQSIPKTSTSLTNGAAASLWTAAPQQRSKSTSPDPEQTSQKTAHPKINPYNPASTTAAQDRQLVQQLPPLQHNVSPQTHLARPPTSPGLPIYGPENKPRPSYPSAQEVRRSRRRGSDSSSDSGGFREVRGGAGEKWFIGGLTAGGEEKYYKLSMVKRDKSSDRLSTDQMSL
ncbi:hypothetical protein TI39_contig346g00021 [Zymoseptoria brevis]|uniref:Uncharacterized protein n=1 Tax=Zymoseptoria brevis TaxID=1047168 RepID=A0A0F4GRC4_9PEZI|nr:hypothetical protein TI39_contig346g00021 [Zymoseptoria brevis]